MSSIFSIQRPANKQIVDLEYAYICYPTFIYVLSRRSPKNQSECSMEILSLKSSFSRGTQPHPVSMPNYPINWFGSHILAGGPQNTFNEFGQLIWFMNRPHGSSRMFLTDTAQFSLLPPNQPSQTEQPCSIRHPPRAVFLRSLAGPRPPRPPLDVMRTCCQSHGGRLRCPGNFSVMCENQDRYRSSSAAGRRRSSSRARTKARATMRAGVFE